MNIINKTIAGTISVLTIIALSGFGFLAGGNLAFASNDEMEIEVEICDMDREKEIHLEDYDIDDEEDEESEVEIEVKIFDTYAEIKIKIEGENIDEEIEVDFTDKEELIQYIIDEYELDEDLVRDVIEFENEDGEKKEKENNGIGKGHTVSKINKSTLDEILTDTTLYTGDPEETVINIFTAIFKAAGFPDNAANVLARVFLAKK